MRNNKKGCYATIYSNPSGERNDYALEIGNEFEAFRIAVDFCDLVSIKNEITAIEDRAKNNEIERN